MLQYPHIDPVAVSLGPLQVHWYGLMYLFGFTGAWWLARKRASRLGLTHEQVGDLVFYGALGVILGGRIGYAIFYHFDRVLAEPLWLFKVWEGGMSFHGGLIGVVLAMLLYARRHQLTLLALGDFIAPMVPIGLGLGRLGNFINGELWGRPTDLWVGMVFPGAGPLPRHPSQLYEFALEGVVLFTVLWLYSSKPRAQGRVAGLFLLGYGVFRTLVEFAREPDAQLGFIAMNWLTMGQLLSIPMMVIGIWLLLRPATMFKPGHAH
ncbi:prolipoprotein diacylglyceryl transferase [Terasakiispira papahanaumokuakeensis]|uniref:Phosphatidylglycerol--prolipoprotein diacylglyceryl transferase n=1 Tax=Terasakiispira papahanaumokuakeensis TaxID=197479 RepID=A0A1E2V6D1_9GAMM|nr:prolipoprotein diacylglyceryl transferase [Terasakiispira papahanaumokuakeensis]ODC02406.1 prolipoprotein diacylglyceryl transferase [Terasakiispira papahanaumokuakeensis]